jgi:hypothetical protein
LSALRNRNSKDNSNCRNTNSSKEVNISRDANKRRGASNSIESNNSRDATTAGSTKTAGTPATAESSTSAYERNACNSMGRSDRRTLETVGRDTNNRRYYTLKKAFRYSCPQPGGHIPNSPWAGIIYDRKGHKQQKVQQGRTVERTSATEGLNTAVLSVL